MKVIIIATLLFVGLMAGCILTKEGRREAGADIGNRIADKQTEKWLGKTFNNALNEGGLPAIIGLLITNAAGLAAWWRHFHVNKKRNSHRYVLIVGNGWNRRYEIDAALTVPPSPRSDTLVCMVKEGAPDV